MLAVATIESKPKTSDKKALRMASSEQNTIFSEVISRLGLSRFASIQKQFPGLVEEIATICAGSLGSSSDAILNSLKGVNSAAGVITSSALFYLPMSSVPFGQKLIALGPGGCGAFEQISHKNYDQYYGWFPMPKVPADNPIRMQFKGRDVPLNLENKVRS